MGKEGWAGGREVGFRKLGGELCHRRGLQFFFFSSCPRLKFC